MKATIGLLGLIWLIQMNPGYSQSQDIDSLKSLLQSEKKDTSRILLFEKLSLDYERSKPDTALLFAQQGFALSQQIHYTKGEVICLTRIGVVFILTGNDAKGLELLLQSLKKSESLNEPLLTGRIMSGLSTAYSDQGDEKKALEYNLKSRDISLALGDKYHLMICSFNIGDSYEKLNQLDSARTYTELAYDLAVNRKDTGLIGGALNSSHFSFFQGLGHSVSGNEQLSSL